MNNLVHGLLLLPLCLSLAGCGSGGEQQTDDNSAKQTEETTEQVASEMVVSPSQQIDPMSAIQDEPYYANYLRDADGDICSAARSILAKNTDLVYHYQRVGCSSDTCRQEFVTYAAVEYPRDSVLQQWMSEILNRYYYDVTRDLDIRVNGEKAEDNGEGETVILNTGCRPYQGLLGDSGKTMFDYYQARVWVVGRDRKDEHGPGGRYGCAIYRCWQTSRVASYFVGYSTDEPQWPTHYIASFDRKSGQKLTLTDILREDCLSEFNDLLTDAARTRHYQLKRNPKCELAIESGDCDYSTDIQIIEVGFTSEGLSVSTGALPFDQWATATHILVIPYNKVNQLLLTEYRG